MSKRREQLENYIKYNDKKMKEAISIRNKKKEKINLTEIGKKKILIIITYMKKNPQESLKNKNEIMKTIKKIVKDNQIKK